MDVTPVMNPKIVMNLFSRQGRQLGLIVKILVVLLSVISLILIGCQTRPSDTEFALGKVEDVTEDLHHRLWAGFFEIGKEPFICKLTPDSSQELRLSVKKRTGAYKMARVSWERGSFWVKADDHALIVIYLDEEVTFSHLQIAPIKGFKVVRQFRELIEHPVRSIQ